ncbi:MAG: cation:proton antiporter [Alloprevotella sp.]|nr:cation:proton antiporter [Alloprevotella sp.]
MSHLPAIIGDLAYILICAGLVTLLFKRLGQPLVLGYIVAGFVAGPHMSFTPTVGDTGSIQTWADIGVIFLMFTLGLEFSVKKIFKMGIRPVAAACVVMFCMMSLGDLVGHLLGWSSINSLFLGGMLAMSSTTIIYKAFDDLGLRQKKFAGEVLSVLILEDILGILLMVVLSAVAVSRHLEGMSLALSLMKLAFFLILWFTIGVFVLPTFLKKSQRWMSGETILIVSVGLCFALVALAAKVGYSSALGAFMMGSIMAETTHAETIERVVAPVKDLFGAIFFVSVGMLVDPAIIVAYWPAVCVITLTIIFGQMIFGTLSFVLSGQSLRTAMQCGFSLTQIGEFAFIIASMGISLGVMGDFLYPVVVAVSVVTTFLTPYMIKAALPAYSMLARLIPERALNRLDSRGSAGNESRSDWHTLLHALAMQTIIYFTLSVAVATLSLGAFVPLLRAVLGLYAGSALALLLTLALLSPLLRAIVMRKNHSLEWQSITKRGRLPRMWLRLTLVIRAALATAVVWYVVHLISPFGGNLRHVVHAALALLSVMLCVWSRWVKWCSIRLERRFVENLRMREVSASRRSATPGYAGRLLSHNMHLAHVTLPAGSAMGGQTLEHLALGRRYGIHVAAIVRGSLRLNIPDGSTKLFPGDTIEAIGDDQSLGRLAERIEAHVVNLPPDDESHRLSLQRYIVGQDCPVCGRTLGQSRLRDKYRLMAVGFEDEDGSIDAASPSRLISEGDTLWIIGEEKDVKAFMMSGSR